MADVDDRGSVGDEEGGKDLWSAILSDVSSSASRKLPSNKSIVLLGSFLPAKPLAFFHSPFPLSA